MNNKPIGAPPSCRLRDSPQVIQIIIIKKWEIQTRECQNTKRYQVVLICARARLQIDARDKKTQTDRQTHSHKDRQIDKQTDRQTQIKKDKGKQTERREKKDTLLLVNSQSKSVFPPPHDLVIQERSIKTPATLIWSPFLLLFLLQGTSKRKLAFF